MSIPFEIPIINQDVVDGVSYSGSTLTLTRAEGSDLTTTIPTGDVVDGVSYSGTTLTLTRAEGTDLTTTIETAADVVTGVSFSGTTLTLARAGTTALTTTIPAAETFTPVVLTGVWTSDYLIGYATQIIPDTFRISEGIDAGYGYSASRTNAFGSFLVSESMAGLYQLAIYFGSKRPTANSGATNFGGMSIGFKLDGETAVTSQSAVGHSNLWSSASSKVPETTLYTVRLPAESQLLIGGFSGFKMSAGSTISIVKLSD